MPTTIVPESFFIGAAKIYYRARGVLTAWTDLGVTTDDAVARINTTWFRPDNINGVMGPIMGLDIMTRVEAEVEFTVPSLTGTNMAVIIPGSVSTAAATTDAGGTPLSTTLATAAAAGDTNIKVAAVTNAAVGDFIRIDVTAGGLAEYRQLTAVGTAGGAGTGLTFRDPLIREHASGVAVVESVGDGRTTITAPTVRRQPTSAYYDWSLVAPTGDKYGELRLLNAISQTESAEITFGDETLAGIRVTIASRYDGSASTTSPYQLVVPT